MARCLRRPRLSEREFLAQVIQLARLLGWRAYHTHDSRRSAAGFPDLVLVRERVVYAELKVRPRTATPEQVTWLADLTAAGQQAYLWYPEHWVSIEEVLRR